tara:strand:- start:4749 stop:5177 length:429 start_codon:yes stop_codon:yes gene_type:complete
MAHPTRIFNTPEELETAWNEYKAFVDSSSSKWAKVQYVGKDGERVTDTPPMPYLEDGFFVWYKNKYGKFIHQYFDNNNGVYNDFVGIVTHIKGERNDNVKTGTLLGFFNASMGNRIAGLSEKSEVNTNANVNILNIDPLSDE